MATYTSNYNLEKPEASDPFGDFRQSYNDNLDIIDQNLGGGGGGGGHTIIDPNGSDMAQRAGLQFTGSCSVSDDAVNDKTIVNISGGNVYGAFVDTSNVIKSQTVFVGSMSYQATEDCYVVISLTTRSNASALVKIDGVTVKSAYISNGTNALGLLVAVKKGQTLSVSDADNNNNSAYTVYGVTQGTSGIFAPVIYSDTERKIGIWRDNKPLYQKTIDLGSDTNISNANWETSVFSISNLEKIILIYGVNSSGTYYPLNAYHSGDDVNLLACRDGNPANIRWVTLQYTKTTDTAGSGDWNTDGVPTVHYSTNEQVIGTYLGKPLYQKTWDNLTVAITANVWANTGISATDIETIVDGTMQDDNLQKIDGTIGFMSSHTYIGVYPQLGNRDLTTLTVQYTKISD